MTTHRISSAGRRLAAIGAVATLAAGCGSSGKTTPSAAKASGAASNCSMTMSGSNATMAMPGCPSTSSTKSSSTSGSSSGMSMSSTVNPATAANLNAKGVSVGGITPIPTQLLASTEWQGMKIQAYATTAVPFVVYNGSSMQEIKPTKKTSFHLMVMLTDADTGVAIPYSTVWATIKQQGKVVYDERQYPMISRYMGPHYGNDVQVPGNGTYQISLLVSPPVSARHVEYKNVWTQPHQTADMTFHWSSPST